MATGKYFLCFNPLKMTPVLSMCNPSAKLEIFDVQSLLLGMFKTLVAKATPQTAMGKLIFSPPPPQSLSHYGEDLDMYTGRGVLLQVYGSHHCCQTSVSYLWVWFLSLACRRRRHPCGEWIQNGVSGRVPRPDIQGND